MLSVSIPKEPWDLSNNNTKNENNPILSNIPLGLRGLLRVFLGRQAHILLQNSKYNYAINLKEGRQPPNLPIYNLSCKELEIL